MFLLTDIVNSEKYGDGLTEAIPASCLSYNPRIKALHKITTAFSLTVAEFLDFEELNDYSFDDEEDNG